jgi:serine/threonine-protein kinase
MTVKAHRAAAALLVTAFVSVPPPALAQPTATSAAAAEKLFQEGRALMVDHRYGDACPKLAESLRLDPAVGTSLNLAECYERVDKVASAWVTYRKAESMARRAGHQERYTHAAARAEALEAKLSYLTITVPSHPKGLAVVRDGERIGDAAWGPAVPVDGGPHVIEASAPGRKPWKQEVQIAPRGGRLTLEVPELAPSDARQDASVDPSTDRTFSVQRTAGWVSLATGGAALGIGFAVGLIANSKNDDAGIHCSAIDCDEQGVTLTRQARSAALVSTILVAVGGTLTAAGIVLVLTAPKRATTRVGLTLSPAGYGLWAAF